MRPHIVAASVAVMAGLLSAAPGRAFEMIPMLGFGEPTGEDSEVFDTGFHFGVSLGGRVSNAVSLHGQLHIHSIAFDNAEIADKAGVSEEEVDAIDMGGALVMLGFAPLFHLAGDSSDVDFVLGPSLGVFGLSMTFSDGLDEITGNVSGLHIGVNAGLFFRVGERASLGPYFHYSRLFAEESCVEVDGIEECDSDPENEDEGVYLLAFAMSFAW